MSQYCFPKRKVDIQMCRDAQRKYTLQTNRKRLFYPSPDALSCLVASTVYCVFAQPLKIFNFERHVSSDLKKGKKKV